MFFLSYYEFTPTQSQHRFWTLTAISDVLAAALECSLRGQRHPVPLANCRAVMLDLLRAKGSEVLD